MPRGRTPFNACAVKFSPYLENRIAVATAQNFGIVGNGRQHVFDVSASQRAAVGSATRALTAPTRDRDRDWDREGVHAAAAGMCTMHGR